eukprot:4286880-Prymnesium_polylepis.1
MPMPAARRGGRAGGRCQGQCGGHNENHSGDGCARVGWDRAAPMGGESVAAGGAAAADSVCGL